jgi:hypothetical protein
MASEFEQTVTQEKPKKWKPLTGGKSGAHLATYENGIKAVIKRAKKLSPQGKKTQRGLLVSTLPRREVAFGKLARLIGPDFMAVTTETVLIDLDGQEASAQKWVTAFHFKDLDNELADRDNDGWVKAFRKVAKLVPEDTWIKLIILDVISGARDRHSNNIGLQLSLAGKGQARYRAVGWDNACTFGRYFRKYHNVIHKYLYPKSIDLTPYWKRLEAIKWPRFYQTFAGLLKDGEIEHAYLRLQFMLEFPYRLPFQIISQGNFDPRQFPEYKPFFLSRGEHYNTPSLRTTG